MCEVCLPADAIDPCDCDCRVYYDAWDPDAADHVMVCVGAGPSSPREHPEQRLAGGCHCGHSVVWMADDRTASLFVRGNIVRGEVSPDHEVPRSPGPILTVTNEHSGR